MINAERIGSSIISGARNSVGSFNLLVAVLKKLHSLFHPPIRRVLYKQIYFTGAKAFNKIAIMGTLIGVVIITQISSIVGFQSPLIGKALVWIIVRELGPLFCALIIIARSCAAIASELGAMKINKEMDAIKVMGIDPIGYLIAPRIVAVTLAMFFLTFYFQLFAIAGGLFLSSLLNDLPLMQHFQEILSVLDLYDVTVSLFKSLIFGLLIAVTSCYHGLRVKTSITEIPQMTTVAVMQSLFMVIIFDGIITVVSYL